MANSRHQPRITWRVVLALCLVYLPGCVAKLSDAFDRFFPDYEDGFQTILHDNCSGSYKQYLQDTDEDKVVIGGYTGFGDVGTANIVVNCILGATPEIIKAKMASAQIVLGLAPSLLASVGVRPQDTAILAVLGRKPILAGLLGAGSPAVFAHRAAEYALAISDLQEPGLVPIQFRSRVMRILLDACIYIIAGASAANVALLAWDLSDKVPFAITPDQTYMPFLWAYLGTIVHVLAAVALWSAAVVESTTVPETGSPQQPQQHQRRAEGGEKGKLWSRVLSYVKDSLTFGEFGHHSHFRVLILPGSLAFYTTSWVTSVFTTCHILFGTILFASSLFISINDSLVVIGRFLASAIVCRILLKIEIVLLRAQIDVARKDAK